MGLRIWGRKVGDRLGLFYYGVRSRNARHNLIEISVSKPRADKDWSVSIRALMDGGGLAEMPFQEMQAEITGVTLRTTFEALCQFEPFRDCIIPEKLEFIDEAWAEHTRRVTEAHEHAKSINALE